MLKSLMSVGMAGTSIVSPYIIMVAIELRIASTFHASRGILFAEGGGNTVGCDDTSDMPYLKNIWYIYMVSMPYTMFTNIHLVFDFSCGMIITGLMICYILILTLSPSTLVS